MTNLVDQHQVKEITEIKKFVSKDETNTILVSQKQIIFNCSYVNDELNCSEGSIINITCDNIPEIVCYMQSKKSVTGPQELGSHFLLYAKTVDGKHVPFYTDPKLAANMDYDLSSVNLIQVVVPPREHQSSNPFQPKRAKYADIPSPDLPSL